MPSLCRPLKARGVDVTNSMHQAKQKHTNDSFARKAGSKTMHMADSDNLNGATAFSTIHEPEPTQADLLIWNLTKDLCNCNCIIEKCSLSKA